ncbi:MAG: polyphosphate kinase 2 family protein [Bryobacteraceae bacterium]
MDFAKFCAVKPGSKVRLADYDPGEKLGLTKKQAKLDKSLERLREFQHLLYADKRHSLLVILQALDAGGKDGTIRHVMSGVNPQGCDVTAFKEPSAEELAHDFLWRVHKSTPKLGNIGIFNRSHYEDVLIVRVHHLVHKDVWSKRYEQINDFERMLSENRVTILKFFLHIGKAEQKKRFRERIQDPTKSWKLSMPDLEERQRWDDYVAAYEDALMKCSTHWAPWYVIPSNHKWVRNVAIAGIIVQTLEKMKLSYPKPEIDFSKLKIV